MIPVLTAVLDLVDHVSVGDAHSNLEESVTILNSPSKWVSKVVAGTPTLFIRTCMYWAIFVATTGVQSGRAHNVLLTRYIGSTYKVHFVYSLEYLFL